MHFCTTCVMKCKKPWCCYWSILFKVEQIVFDTKSKTEKIKRHNETRNCTETVATESNKRLKPVCIAYKVKNQWLASVRATTLPIHGCWVAGVLVGNKQRTINTENNSNKRKNRPSHRDDDNMLWCGCARAHDFLSVNFINCIGHKNVMDWRFVSALSIQSSELLAQISITLISIQSHGCHRSVDCSCL